MYTVRMRTGLCIMCVAICLLSLVCLGYETYQERESLGTDMAVVVVCFAVLIIYLAFYAVRKRVVVEIEGFVYYPAIGKKKYVTWNEIDMVKTSPAKDGKDITLYNRKNHRICKLEASMKNQKDFIETMRIHHVPIW